MDLIFKIFSEAWELLLESSVYILFGLLISGLLRVFLNPQSVIKHLGVGRFRSVFKAAVLGIPIPLCSCGVLPAAVGLKRQGANNGATTAFLISTPESGVDSIAISYALLDPIMTIVRPVVGFVTAFAAGITENLFGGYRSSTAITPDLSCVIDRCCDGVDCPPHEHRRHHSFFAKLKSGIGYAARDVWADLALWFFIGLLLAGLITALIPADLMSRYLGPGFFSMLLMLAIGIPMYICATASTPVAAALILKGVSPGAALVFLIAGPATNITSLTVLTGVLGKRATAIYLGAIALSAIIFGMLVDQLYAYLAISPQAVMGQAAEMVPEWAKWAGTALLVALSLKPLSRQLSALLKKWHERITGCSSSGKDKVSSNQTDPTDSPSVCGGST